MQETHITSFEFFEILKFNIFHLFKYNLIFYLLKMIQYDKIQHLHKKFNYTEISSSVTLSMEKVYNLGARFFRTRQIFDFNSACWVIFLLFLSSTDFFQNKLRQKII